MFPKEIILDLRELINRPLFFCYFGFFAPENIECIPSLIQLFISKDNQTYQEREKIKTTKVFFS